MSESLSNQAPLVRKNDIHVDENFEPCSISMDYKLFPHQERQVRVIEVLESSTKFQRVNNPYYKSNINRNNDENENENENENGPPVIIDDGAQLVGDEILCTSARMASLACLCDPPGSGKSFVAIAHIAKSLARRVDLEERDEGGGNLVVVPWNIFDQWKRYIKENFAALNVCFLTQYADLCDNGLFIDPMRIHEFDMVLAVPDIVETIVYPKTRLARVFIDEVDSIKTSSGGQKWVWRVLANARFAYFITASPERMHNPQHVEKAMNFPLPRPQFYITTLPKYLEQSLEYDRGYTTHKIACRNKVPMDVLQGIVSDTMMRRLDAGVRVVPGDPHPINAILKNMSDAVAETTAMLESTKRTKHINPHAGELEAKIETSIKNLRGRIESIKNRVETRALCFSCYEISGFYASCCKRYLCAKCAPLEMGNHDSEEDCCNGSFKLDVIDSHGRVLPIEISKISTTTEKGSVGGATTAGLWHDPEGDKFENVLRFLQHRAGSGGGARVIVFSQYLATIDVLASMLKKEGLPHTHLEDWGDISTLDTLIKGFKTPPVGSEISILLMNANNFGSGLNIPETTDVCIFHCLDPCLRKQVIGRGLRPGRREALHVYDFCNTAF